MAQARRRLARTRLLAGVATAVLWPLAGLAETPHDGAITLSVEGRFLWSSGARQPWVEFNQPFNVPGDYRFVRVDEAWAGKIAAMFRVGDGWDIGVAYTGLRSRAKNDRVGDPNNPSYQGFLVVPAIGDLRFGLFQGDVEARTRFDVVDFDAGFRAALRDRVGIRLFAGLRYANYRQDVNVTLRGLSNTHNDDVSEATYWAIGPRVGLNADIALLKTGAVTFGLHGGVAGAALFGRGSKEITTNYYPLGTLALTFRADDDYDRMVWNGEASLGAHIAFPLGPWMARLSAGYRGEAWWGLVNTRTVSPIQGQTPLSRNEVLGTKSGNLYQHGPYVRFSVDF